MPKKIIIILILISIFVAGCSQSEIEQEVVSFIESEVIASDTTPASSSNLSASDTITNRII